MYIAPQASNPIRANATPQLSDTLRSVGTIGPAGTRKLRATVRVNARGALTKTFLSINVGEVDHRALHSSALKRDSIALRMIKKAQLQRS